jgi:hypothetical protein
MYIIGPKSSGRAGVPELTVSRGELATIDCYPVRLVMPAVFKPERGALRIAHVSPLTDKSFIGLTVEPIT